MILITGASSGVGHQLASNAVMERLANEFYQHKSIVGTYFNNKYPCFKDFIGKYNKLIKVFWEKLNLENEEEINKFCENMIENMLEKQRNIVFIHCAGVSINSYLSKTTSEAWNKTFDINVKSAFLICKHLLPIMRETGYGRIIFISSVVPQIGVAGTCAYSASKAALWGLTKSLAKECAPFGDITCNCINLGYMSTGMTFDQINEKQREEIIETIPLRKLGDTDNITSTVKFLIENNYTTGTQINVNGGLI